MANRLQFERSPYLLQHRDNPVDWWAWSEEAFAEARARDVPIFLSVGYSTCHWCHVMERESFENPEVARLMNQTFVNVKVDREERPDIDTVYMTVCQLLTGSGGWPLTVILTPEREPLYAATYIAPTSRHGRIGMMDLVPQVQQAWRESRSAIQSDVRTLTEALRRGMSVDTRGVDPTSEDLDRAFDQLRHSFDPVYGGFGSAPKFPSPHTLLFLLRYARRTGKAEPLRMVEKTLRAMRLGGIFDHVGRGFHRYSTDRQWKLPHFEKMLYDQALMALAYTEAFQATDDEEFGATAEEVLSYVLFDLGSVEGGFHTAEDADSEGREGTFYLWRSSELEETLGPDLARRVMAAYNVRAEGNFLDESTRGRTGENILHLRDAAAADGLREALERLCDRRNARVRPALDDKVLTDWNGLTVAALALAARTFLRNDWLKAAEDAARFLLDTMFRGGRLLHSWRNGEAGIEGMLDDYAFVSWGLLELYTATFDPNYLMTAVELCSVCLTEFREGDSSAFFMTASDAESLIVRPRDAYDGAVPSGNSVMAMNLLRLARLTRDADFQAAAEDVFRFYAEALRARPSGFTAMLSAVEFGLGPTFEVVVAGEPGEDDTVELLRTLVGVPNVVVHLRPPDPSDIVDLLPFLEPYTMRGGVATAYVCRDWHCEEPTSDPGAMLYLINKTRHA